MTSGINNIAITELVLDILIPIIGILQSRFENLTKKEIGQLKGNRKTLHQRI